MTETTQGAPPPVPRVLIVEDEYFIADDLARASVREGMGVVGPVASREEALAILATAEVIDAAILDVNVLGDTTYDVASALEQRGTPFVFASGYDAEHVGFHNVPCWQKPFEADLLVKSLRAMIDR